MNHQVSPVGSDSRPLTSESTPAGEVLLLEIGDRAFLYAEKHQRDERWWLGEWARVENRRIAYKATKGEK